MTVATEVSAVEYEAAPDNYGFPVGFAFLATSHVRVTLTLPGGTPQTLTEGVDYTVVEFAEYAGGPAVELTVGPASGSTVLIERVVPLLQTQSFSVQGSFSGALHEAAFDYLTFIAQQLARRLEALEAGDAAYDAALVTSTFTTDSEDVEATFPVTVSLGAGVVPLGVRLVRAENLTDGAAIFPSPPGIDWAPGADSVSLRYVSGLEPSTQYRLTLEVLT